MVNPMLVLCTVVGLTVEDLSEAGGPFLGLEGCEFKQPVYPGEEVVTEIWVGGDTVSFRCRVPQRDAVVINNGRCRLVSP